MRWPAGLSPGRLSTLLDFKILSRSADVSASGDASGELPAYAPELNPVERVWSTMEGSIDDVCHFTDRVM
jgi:hypothetical protein